MNIILEDKLKTNLKICSRCIYDERVSAIYFDEVGICNYCHQIENLKIEYGTSKEKGNKKLQQIIKEIKETGKHKKYDCKTLK